jgi:uncharacterized phage protein (TIGR02220 family)
MEKVKVNRSNVSKRTAVIRSNWHDDHPESTTENTTEITGKDSCPVAEQPDHTESADPAQRVLDHFNLVTESSYGRGGKQKTVMGFINGRLADMYSAEDLILVTEYATAKWLKDPKMSDYLRPKTLFGPENFGEYFQKATKWHKHGRPECVDGKWVAAQAVNRETYSNVDYNLPANAGFRT